jgi:hypothetical protein
MDQYSGFKEKAGSEKFKFSNNEGLEPVVAAVEFG